MSWLQGNFRAEITTPVAVTPEIVRFSGTVAYDPFRRLGLSSLEATWELTVQLGRVTVFNFNFTPGATARLQAALVGGAPASAGSGGGGSTTGSSGGGGGQAASGGAPSGRVLALTGIGMRPAAAAAVAIGFGALLLLATGRRAGGRR